MVRPRRSPTPDPLVGKRPALLGILAEGQRRGFLGPGPVANAVDHALGFAVAAGSTPPPTTAADLGSGGGVPGLVLAVVWPQTRWSFIESQQRRCVFLRSAVDELGLDDPVTIVHARAEEVGRDPAHRGAYDVVVARGFGPPSVVAECAAPLLRVGGTLIVSEPPGGAPERWAADGLALLGMQPADTVTDVATYQCLRQVDACPDRFPRRVGILAKRPLF